MAEDKQAKIIAAALKLFETEGYHTTKVSDIVQEAGVAQGTFYLYFKSKEDLFRDITEACLGEVAETLEKEGTEECGEQMYRTISNVLRVFALNRSILHIIYKHGFASNELKDITERFHLRLMKVVKSQLVQANAYPGYTEEQLEIAAYSKIGMVEKCAYQWFVVKNCGMEYIEIIAHTLVDILDCTAAGRGEASM
ncbi:TetR/AcrR family transcriptional regulator [Paenibacillus thalictri]|uniref:TetR/AcrR family transcriptional regulator n=1 Tax=Paenibacillus thalictri TaxID=2527873 RepID=A0A4Q9DLW3_9BACL|nr:TetR/AcrR family transcriptional regulator [Paenibacillus thalictri]TBL75042.1 TetR/AcrR family transcriptional regulator [Paenibacillus thalictri]